MMRMTDNAMVELYTELTALYNHESYVVSDDEHQEYQDLCVELLSMIVRGNDDILRKLKKA